MDMLEDYSRGDNQLTRTEAPREANAAEMLFRYLLRQEQLGDTSIKYIRTAKPLIYEGGGSPEGAEPDVTQRSR